MTYSQIRVVSNEAEARSAVYRWCARTGQEPGRYEKLVVEISKTLPNSPIPEDAFIDYLAHFATATINAEKRWDTHERDAWSQNSIWAVETVKHLAFLNAAGLAGATAALSTSEAVGPCMPLSLLLLGVGLVLAVLCMWIISTGYEKRAIGLRKRFDRVHEAQTWAEYSAAEGEPYVDGGEKWFNASIWVGWISAGCAIAGLALLIFILS